MLLHALLLSALAALVSADCYSHDRIKAQDSKYYIGPELVSCGNGTDNCCLAEQKCGSNLLCVDGSGGVSRQYCDNAAWPASTSAPAATTASSASSATPTPTETAKGSSGISGGAGAGIGIGAAAGIALVAALMWFLLRKKKQNASRGAVSGTTDYPIGKSGPQPEYYAHNVELDNGNLVSQELDGGNSRHELATHAPKTYPGL
ncbi:hypothetical protein DPSP01_011581 [Paraphaeosphaeria sporulosa]